MLTQSTGSPSPSSSTEAPVQTQTPVLQFNKTQLEAEIVRARQLLESLESKRGEEDAAKNRAREDAIEEFMKLWEIDGRKDFQNILRNRGAKSPKAKRLPESTLRIMKHVLTKGASAPAVAKHFHLSLATVHARKKQWGLVGRKTVKLMSMKDALKGAPSGA